MQRLFDARPIVAAERREVRDDRRHVFVRHRVVGEEDEVVFEARFRPAAEIEDDFDHPVDVRQPYQRLSLIHISLAAVGIGPRATGNDCATCSNVGGT